MTIAPLDRPVFVGCAGRCGAIVPILWPSSVDVRLDQLRAELVLPGFQLATVEAAGEPCTAILCTRCATVAVIRTKIKPPERGRVVDVGKKRK